MAIDGDECAYSLNWLMLPAYALFRYHMLPRNVARDPARRARAAAVIESEGRVEFSAIVTYGSERENPFVWNSTTRRLRDFEMQRVTSDQSINQITVYWHQDVRLSDKSGPRARQRRSSYSSDIVLGVIRAT
jgi:hypothetical protein